MRRIMIALAAVLAISSAGLASAQAPPSAASARRAPSDAEIRKILADRIDVQHQGVGIVVGVVDAKGRRIVAYGALDKGDPRPLAGDTLFEIGSMTKVFTSLLLADAVERGEVKLDDPVAKYLPAGVRVPERGGRQITLVDLATHTSGLPRIPSNLSPKDRGNPYADYTVDQLYQFLGSYTLTRDIGSRYEYSNLGGGLLGHVLARQARTDYETLVRQRITGPLGMASTTIALSPAMKARMATGHAQTLEPVSNWDMPTLAGAGALRSDANDILTLLSAELGYVPTPLKLAMATQLSVRRPTDISRTQIALGWHITATPGGEIFWHNGGTGGFRAFMGFDAKRGVGVVVLTNVSNTVGGDDIGFHMLTGAPLTATAPPLPAYNAIAVDPKILEGYVGRYQFAPQAVLTVTRDGARLFAQLTGQPTFEIFPETSTSFFLKVVDAQITFQVGPDGEATSLILHQNGQNVPGRRVDAAGP